MDGKGKQTALITFKKSNQTHHGVGEAIQESHMKNINRMWSDFNQFIQYKKENDLILTVEVFVIGTEV